MAAYQCSWLLALCSSYILVSGRHFKPLGTTIHSKSRPGKQVISHRQIPLQNANPSAQILRSSPPGQSYRQILRNDADVQYTGKILLGAQELDIVPDTGSFELVVFSDKCSGCGKRPRLFHAAESRTLREGKIRSEKAYGSGNAKSIEAYDDLRMGDILVRQQMFWNVVDAEMPVLEFSSLQGIHGLGAPRSNIMIALQDARTIHTEAENLRKSGQANEGVDRIVEMYDNVASFTKTISTWLKNTRMTTFSVCLGQASGSPGYFIYNDDSNVELFTHKVDVDSDLYWSAPLHNVHIGAPDSPSRLFLGCGETQKCNAVLDTGTSLIAAPQKAIDHVVLMLDKINQRGGGCENISTLPNLEFVLGGQKFSLPPESYVGQVVDDAHDTLPKWVRKHMPHLHSKTATARRQVARRTRKPICEALMMNIDQQSDMWILGLPFFRKYYTMFQLTPDSMRMKSIHFAEADDSCILGSTSSLRLPSHLRMPLRVDLRKMMPPRKYLEASSVLEMTEKTE